MSLRSTVLKIQQAFVEDGAENVRLEKIPSAQLEPGVQRVDLHIEGWRKGDRVKVMNQLNIFLTLTVKLKKDSFDGFQGFNENPKEAILVGIDTDEAGNGLVSVELHTEEALKYMMGERKVETSFKKFLTEARKAGVNVQEEKTKGVVTKLIAQLEGSDAAQLTKVARQYHAISKALDKLEAKKKELNAALKDQVGATFDAELDKYTTRVLASAHFTATLAKETPPEDVKEKVEVNYEALVAGLMALLTEDLKPAAEELLKGATRRWKPDPKSPNLTVKPLDEGVADTLAGWYRAAKKVLQACFSRFDKNLASLEKRLAKYKAGKLTESVDPKYAKFRELMKAYLIGAVKAELDRFQDDWEEDGDDSPAEHHYEAAWDGVMDDTTNHIDEIDDEALIDEFHASGLDEDSDAEYALCDGLKDEVIEAVRKQF